MPRKSSDPSGSSSRSRDELLWLETYFILFPRSRRPTLAEVEKALSAADSRLRLENLAADGEGLFESLLVESPEDHAAVEVSFESGDAVLEQNHQWARQLKKQLSPQLLQEVAAADARLDVAHFERVQDGAAREGRLDASRDSSEDDDFNDDDFEDGGPVEVFDPTCLLTVVEALSALTKGVAFDPAAGEVV